MDHFCGIDIGASTAKLVLIDAERQVVAMVKQRSGVDYAMAADELRDLALGEAGLVQSDIVRALSTGYGRDNVPWSDAKMTEIACHGKGACYHFPGEALTVIDIGAQDSKIIHLDENGRRLNFKMNRKCAAGTGAFIEEIAYRLALDVSQLDSLAEQSTSDTPLGSFCTVFAATEVLARIRAGEPVSDIVSGAFHSVVKRIVEMDRCHGRLVTSGGVVAHNPFLVKLLGEAFQAEAVALADAQYAGALGAALFALDQVQKPKGNN